MTMKDQPMHEALCADPPVSPEEAARVEDSATSWPELVRRLTDDLYEPGMYDDEEGARADAEEYLLAAKALGRERAASEPEGDITFGGTAYVLVTLRGEQGFMSASVGVYSSPEVTMVGPPAVSFVLHVENGPSFHEAAKGAEAWVEQSFPALMVRAMEEGATFREALSKMHRGEDCRAPFKVDDRGRISFHAELDGSLLRCSAWVDVYEAEMVVLVGGDVLDGVDDLDAYFSDGVYTSLDGFRRGDRRDFKAVVEAAAGGK